MNNDEITREQMTEFCELARAAVAADRAVIITTAGDNKTNMAVSAQDKDQGQQNLLADITMDLARTIVSINPHLTIELHSPDGDVVSIDSKTFNLRVVKRTIEPTTH